MPGGPAEDIFQNVALKAMTREVSFETEAALLSWAFITARREGIDWLRRHRREALSLDTEILELLEHEWQAAPAHPSGETMLRVNEGSARVRQNLDGSTAEVSKGRQVTASLSRKESLSVTPQPGPINSWASDLWQIPQVILGKWLPPTGNERARLGADPLLWPISDRDSVMLYAVALATTSSCAQGRRPSRRKSSE